LVVVVARAAVNAVNAVSWECAPCGCATTAHAPRAERGVLLVRGGAESARWLRWPQAAAVGGGGDVSHAPSDGARGVAERRGSGDARIRTYASPAAPPHEHQLRYHAAR
jgi:hypothetical protein